MNKALKDAKMAWIPGMRDHKPVRTQYTLPVKFKLREPLDFQMVGLDTVYVITDDSLSFRGGNEALAAYLAENLNYPKAYKDSCLIGDMDIKVLVQADGFVKVLDVNDYGKLGSDFQFEAIQTATSTFGQWTSATRKGRKVPSAYDFFVVFKPTEAHCQSRVTEYEQANLLVEEGSNLFNGGDTEAGIQKFSEAIDLFPKNASYLYLRGQAYMNTDRNDEACADFIRVKAILPIGIVNQLLPILCKE
jgi:tetratricopeptide (TPR) repeat protein